MPKFDDATIERLFGAEDAENEIESRFKEYFYYNSAYSSLVSDLPIRILVGHKGVGKSALLKRAYLDDLDRSNLSIWLRPDDFTSVKENTKDARDFNVRIQNWKTGILQIVANRAIDAVVSENIPFSEAVSGVSIGRGFINSIAEKIVSLSDKIQEGSSAKIARSFGESRTIVVYIDDIDRGWSASREDITNISALLNAIRDISGDELGCGVMFTSWCGHQMNPLIRSSAM